MNGICVVGDNCVDVYHGEDTTSYPGGNAVNVAIALRRTGARCGYIGVVGSDSYGEQIAETLRSEGVDTTRLRTLDGPTAWTSISVSGGERVFDGEDLGVQTCFALSKADFDYLSHGTWCHFTGFTNWAASFAGAFGDYHEYIRGQLSAMHGARLPLSMDFSDTDDTRLFSIAGEFVHTAFVSREALTEAQLERELRRLHHYGFHLVVVTLGANGSAAYDGHSLLRRSAFPVEVVDTTGAGDGFIGAFLSSRLAGSPLDVALSEGSEHAALICSRRGAF